MGRPDPPLERIALGDQVLDGVEVPDGAHVCAVTAAAHPDPARFADPDAFDIRREPHANLGFGFGAHYCVGASLGRAEAAMTLQAMARRWPTLSLACDPGEVRHRPHLTFRGLERLPMAP